MSGQVGDNFQPQRLRDEMARTGFNDEKVAVLTNVRVKSVERWRRGSNVPHPNNVRALAEAFGRDLEFFYREPEREAA